MFCVILVGMLKSIFLLSKMLCAYSSWYVEVALSVVANVYKIGARCIWVLHPATLYFDG